MHQYCIWLQHANGEIAWIHDSTKRDESGELLPGWSQVEGELPESDLEFEELKDQVPITIGNKQEACDRVRPTWKWRGVIVKQGLNITLKGVDSRSTGGRIG